MKQKIQKRHIHELSPYDVESLVQQNISSLVTPPSDYSDPNTEITVYYEASGYDGGSGWFNVTFSRLENDAEFEERLEKEKIKEAQVKKQELELLSKLKEKYESKQ